VLRAVCVQKVTLRSFERHGMTVRISLFLQKCGLNFAARQTAPAATQSPHHRAKSTVYEAVGLTN
jgi:hypothetical protein